MTKFLQILKSFILIAIVLSGLSTPAIACDMPMQTSSCCVEAPSMPAASSDCCCASEKPVPNDGTMIPVASRHSEDVQFISVIPRKELINARVAEFLSAHAQTRNAASDADLNRWSPNNKIYLLTRCLLI